MNEHLYKLLEEQDEVAAFVMSLVARRGKHGHSEQGKEKSFPPRRSIF